MQGRNRSRSNSSQGSNRDGGDFVEPSKRLFVGGISNDVEDYELRSEFEKIGTVNDFFFRKVEGRNPFAFVEMSSIDVAEEAISRLHGKKVGDKMIFVKYSRPRPPKEGGNGGGFKKNEGFKPEGKDRFDRKPRVNDRGNFGGRGDQGNRKPRNGDSNRSPKREELSGFGRQDRKDGYQKRERNEYETPQRINGGQSRPTCEDFDY